MSSRSRIFVAVHGEVVDTATNERKLVENWTYRGEPFGPTTRAANKSELLKSQMKKAWAKISSDIVESIVPKFAEASAI